jgi:FtsH-binding integral membrane protein
MELLQQGHGLIRWVVLLAGVLGVLTVWRQTGPSRPGGILTSVFLALLDLQLVLGVLLVVLDAESRAGAWPHVGVMATAIVLAHVLRVRSKKADGARSLMIATLLAPLILVGVGLLLL